MLQEFFTGLLISEGGYKENYIYITLNRDSSASNVQLVLADFKVDDFKLTVKPKYEVGDDYMVSWLGNTIENTIEGKLNSS